MGSMVLLYFPLFFLGFSFFLYFEREKRSKRKITFISQFITDKRVYLRYNTLCIYMWTYAHMPQKGGPSWKASVFTMCPSWSMK